VSGTKLPTIDEGTFRHWFYLQDANCFIHLAGRTATFSWTGEPSSGESRHGFALPGDAVGD